MDYHRDNFDYKQIRKQSLIIASDLGYEPSVPLPLLDDSLVPRSLDEIIGRSLALLCVVVFAYGFGSRDIIQRWLKTENLERFLTPDERGFLFEGDALNIDEYKTREECLWTFTWALGFHEKLDFSEYCQPSLSSFFPRFTENENSEAFRARCRLRPKIELLSKLDLAYCLHWSITERKLKGKQRTALVHPYLIIQRRHALEWMLCQEDWNNTPLNT